MKLIFRLFLTIICFSNFSNAAVIQISYVHNFEKAKQVQKIIEKKFYIPKEFIIIRHTPEECRRTNNYVFEFCINEKSEMLTLNSRPSFYKKNLKIFEPERIQLKDQSIKIEMRSN